VRLGERAEGESDMNYQDLLTAHTQAVRLALRAALELQAMHGELSSQAVTAETMDRVVKLERAFIGAAREMVLLDDVLKKQLTAPTETRQ
jgi:hypothetical protein